MSSSTISQQEALDRMYKIVEKFMAHPDAVAFNKPVNWMALGLYDYLEVIPNPIL